MDDAGFVDTFYTVGELADMLKVSQKAIYRLVESGDLLPHSIGGELRFRKEDIESFLDEASGSSG